MKNFYSTWYKLLSVSYLCNMRKLACCVGFLCLVTRLMAVKVKFEVTVQEIAEDQGIRGRQDRQLSSNINLDGRLGPVVFATSLSTAMLQNVISEIFASGQYFL